MHHHIGNGIVLTGMAVGLPVAAETIAESSSAVLGDPAIREVIRQTPALIIFAYVMILYLRDRKEYDERAAAERELGRQTGEKIAEALGANTEVVGRNTRMLDRLDRKLDDTQ